MGAEITLQALNGELREFFLGAPGVNHVFVVQLAEFFEETDCAIRRVISRARQGACLRGRLRTLRLCYNRLPKPRAGSEGGAHDAEFQIAQSGFDLHAFGAVVVIDMLDLMTEDSREFVLAGHQVQQSFADVDRAARKREGIDHGAVGQKMKRIRQMAVGCRLTELPTRRI